MKKFLRNTIDKFGELRIYFLRGYTQYFSLIISIVSHSLIIYNFVIKNVFFLSFFERYTIFFISFISFLIPISILIGKFDYKKGTYKKETEVWGLNSPLWQQNFKDSEQIKQEINELNKKIDSLFEDRFKTRISNLLNNLPEDEELRALVKKRLKEYLD